MTRTKNVLTGATVVAVLALLGVVQSMLEQKAAAQGSASASVEVPRFEVDPRFPKPMPNGWYQGMSIGVSVDAQDHVWIVHRPDSVSATEAAADEKTGTCCSKAPPILEFDQQGNLLRHWGGHDGPGYQWPSSNHGITIDYKGNVWIGGNGAGDGSTWDIAFSKDPQQRYIYLADGHDEKVWILDRQSLDILTSFGDGGRQPGQFYAVHSVAVDSKGNLYTTETYEGRRLQRFMLKGTKKVPRGTDQGTVWPSH
jgi:hypothetical protein